MRILILTDSLGCPREEIKVEDTWTEKILSKYQGNGNTIYTWCCYGLSVKDIPYTYIRYLNPDLIICQVGIVDACRRALKVKEEIVISKIPFVGKTIRAICSKWHYQITKIRNIHRVDVDDFNNALSDLAVLSNLKLLLIEIAPPGLFLIHKTYHVADDVGLYNDIIYDKEKNSKVDVIKPYSTSGVVDCKEYLLETDGHHLNREGHLMVFKALNQYLISLISKDNVVENI